MMSVLSREPDSSILGFSSEVASEVTHPECPRISPRRIRVSDMMHNRRRAEGNFLGIDKGPEDRGEGELSKQLLL